MDSDHKTIHLNIRPASLEDADSIAELQNQHVNALKILAPPRSAEKIRLAIGSSFLNKNSIYVVEEESNIIGFLEQTKQNHSHVMISYPYVALDHPNRDEIQRKLIETTLNKLAKFGYQFVSTRVSRLMEEADTLFSSLGFDERQIVFQSYEGTISPDPNLGSSGIDFRRVKLGDSDIVYRWIKRQLNPMSPIYITREYFEKLLHAPKHVRDGWSMAIDSESRKPLAMISSMIDAHTGDVIVFGPYNDQGNDEARLMLLNELLWHHTLQGKERMKLMRIQPFDNDNELISTFGLDKTEEITILSRKIL